MNALASPWVGIGHLVQDREDARSPSLSLLSCFLSARHITLTPHPSAAYSHEILDAYRRGRGARMHTWYTTTQEQSYRATPPPIIPRVQFEASPCTSRTFDMSTLCSALRLRYSSRFLDITRPHSEGGAALGITPSSSLHSRARVLSSPHWPAAGWGVTVGGEGARF